MKDAVLLFDLGGVLVENDMFAELARLMGSGQSEAELIEVWLGNPVARRFELGQCSVDAFSESVISEFDLPMSPAEFIAAFKGWPKGLAVEATRLLAQLRKSHTVCCLSNSNEVHWSDALTQHFHQAFSSHLIGQIKPDPGAFAYIVDQLDVDPGDIHFFDDAPLNVAAAQGCGLNAYHTAGFDSLCLQLRELGFSSDRE